VGQHEGRDDTRRQTEGLLARLRPQPCQGNGLGGPSDRHPVPVPLDRKYERQEYDGQAPQEISQDPVMAGSDSRHGGDGGVNPGKAQG